MDTVGNYGLLWSIYLATSAIFFAVFWRITRFRRRIWLSYTLRGVTLALALTPWYANQAGTVMAPALIVVMLDAITIGGAAAVRSFVPLLLAVIAAFIIATVWYFINRKLAKKNIKKHKVKAKIQT